MRARERTDVANNQAPELRRQGVSLKIHVGVMGIKVLALLRKIFAGKTAVEANRDNPVLRAVVSKSAIIYDQIPLRDHITEQTRVELGRQLFLEINGICNAASPLMVCREKLATTMLKFACYQVLVIPPAPEEDASGLRGQPGITGALKEQLVGIAQENISLRAEVREATDSSSFAAVWEVVQRSYWKWFWYLGTFDAARLELHDVENDCDWYTSFMHAACANQEHLYRLEMGMPPAFDEAVARRASTAYSIFTDIVLSGEEHPVAAWHDFHKDCNIPMPPL